MSQKKLKFPSSLCADLKLHYQEGAEPNNIKEQKE